jgi:hypothetical protein
MKKNLTDITTVLDRSGSTATISKDICGGFDSFVEDQRKADGECLLTLLQFDTEYEVVYSGKQAADVPPLAHHPRGMTALLDSVGRAITETGERIAKLPEEERPGRVLFLIITDGLENSSKEWTHAQLMDSIKKQREQWKWDFVFLAADQDAIQEGEKFGIAAANAVNIQASPEGIRKAYAMTSAAVTSARSASTASWDARIAANESIYTDEQKEEIES